MTKVLALLGALIQMSGQVLPPTKFPDLPARFKQTVIAAFSQTCTGSPPVFSNLLDDCGKSRKTEPDFRTPLDHCERSGSWK